MVSRRSKVVLPCLAVGQPLPTHSWTAPDGSFPQNEDFTVLKDGSLEISDVQRHHQGNYTCFVSNANGSDHIIYNLRVLGKNRLLSSYVFLTAIYHSIFYFIVVLNILICNLMLHLNNNCNINEKYISLTRHSFFQNNSIMQELKLCDFYYS